MHLIFLATLLVSILLPWLHPSLASLGRYCHSLLAFCHFNVIAYAYHSVLCAEILFGDVLWIYNSVPRKPPGIIVFNTLRL